MNPIEIPLSPADRTVVAPSLASESATPFPVNNYDDEYLIQLMLLDQQNKGRPDYVPSINDSGRRPHRVDGVFGNLFVDGDGRLLCPFCSHNMYKSDNSLWSDLKSHVHVTIPIDLRTGPDLYQCFCGYFSFREEDCQRHLKALQKATEPGQNQGEVMQGLLRRIKQINMHEECRYKLMVIINGEE